MELTSRPTHTAVARSDRILIIDDEAVNLRLLSAILRREGYTALAEVSDSREAHSTFVSFAPDLVLLDLHMPEMDGFAVLEQLRRDRPVGDYLPVLVLTGDTTLQAKRRALSSGATDLLGKPFDTVEITLRIDNLLETRRLHRALQRHNQQLEEKVAERTRQLEVALHHAEAAREAKENFLAKMSHELRTPLNAANGALEMLRLYAGASLAGEGSRMLEMASRNLEHMVGLVNEILYLQSIEQGTIELDIFPAHLGPLVESVVERAASRLRTSSVAVHQEVPRGLPPVVTDPVRLCDVLWRLLDNAVRFTPAGEIRVLVVPDPATGGAARIDVVDTGVGIPPEHLEAIFEPFEQADNSSTRRYEGAGIGLALCRALCTLLGFRLVAESEPGRGSTFSILLQPE